MFVAIYVAARALALLIVDKPYIHWLDPFYLLGEIVFTIPGLIEHFVLLVMILVLGKTDSVKIRVVVFVAEFMLVAVCTWINYTMGIFA